MAIVRHAELTGTMSVQHRSASDDTDKQNYGQDENAN